MDASALQTSRLVLRRWRREDGASLFALRSHPDVARWMADPTPWADPARAVEQIEQWQAAASVHPDLGTWAIVPRGATEPGGSASLKQIDDSDGEIEVGWALHPDAWGRGYAREAGAALLDHARVLRLRRVWALMWPGNTASARVCTALGMTDLGVRPDPWYGGDSHMFLVEGPDTPDRATASGDDRAAQPT